MVFRYLLILTVYAGLIIDMHFANGGWKQSLDFFNLLVFSLSGVFLFFVFWAIDINLKKKWAQRVSTGLIFLYILLSYYQRNTGSSLDYGVVVNNWHAIDNREGFIQVLKLINSIYIASNVFWSVFVSILIYFSYRWFKTAVYSKWAKQVINVSITALSLVFILISNYSHDQYSRFLRSALRYYIPGSISIVGAPDLKKMSYLSPVDSISTHTGKIPPNIILVMVESFNSRFIGKKHTPTQKSFLPYFESLIPQGVYASNYYSTSVQTAKGHFGILCGQLPNIKSIEFRSDTCSQIKCLPTILKDSHYENYFLQAHADGNFDHERDYLLTHGFDEAPLLANSCDQEKDLCVGWGIRDDVFYERAIKFLSEKKNAHGDKPIFAALATIASHQPFNLQEKYRTLYPAQKNRLEGYLNYMPLVDDGFKTLINKIKQSSFGDNTILIITGDHGFPLGEHGNSHNENYAYNENFQVPLLILDLRKSPAIKPDIIEKPLSHLNLPLTILDLAGYSGTTPFIAASIFSDRSDPVYLVQPYSGGYLSVVKGQYKYILELSREREFVFDLKADPKESENIKSTVDQTLLIELRAAAFQIQKQQEIFTCNE